MSKNKAKLVISEDEEVSTNVNYGMSTLYNKHFK
jgi:hypothetical protein